jgi:hypothetical protein
MSKESISQGVAALSERSLSGYVTVMQSRSRSRANRNLVAEARARDSPHHKTKTVSRLSRSV